MKILLKSLLLFLTIFATSISLSEAQVTVESIKLEHERIKKDSIALSPEFHASLTKLTEWTSSQASLSPKTQAYTSLLLEYLRYLKPSTFRKYASSMHDDIIAQALPILQAASDPEMDMKQWTNSLLPEYYPAVKILIPTEIAQNAVLNMAKERPQELIGQFAWLDYTQDQQDLINAIKSSPHQFSKFMHYNNQVKKVLQQSQDPNIKLMFEIYAKYRYSDNAYYLLPLIASKSLSIEEAEEAAKVEHTLMNLLAKMVTDSSDLAKNSVQEKWSLLTGKYLSYIKKSKFAPVNTWNLDAFEKVNDVTRLTVLFLNNNTLSATETEAFMRWILLRHFNKPLKAEYLDKIPLKNILQLQQRVEEQKLQLVWEQMWGVNGLNAYIQNRRKQMDPVALNSLQKELNIKTNTTITLPKPKEPEFIIKTYYFNLSDEEKAFIKWKNDPLTALEKVKEWIDLPFAGKLLNAIALQYPLDVVRHLDDIKLKAAGIEALKTVGYQAPLTAKNFIVQPLHPWNHLFRSSKDSIIKTLYTIHQEAGINTRAYLLLDDILNKKISIKDADSLCRVPDKLLPMLMKIISKPNALGRFSVEQELSAKALKFVRQVNISENTDKYFEDELKNISPELLYTFITYGEDELIERGFKKLFNRLASSVPEGNIYPLMEKMGFNQYRRFLRKCSYYEMGPRLYGAMSNAEKTNLAKRLLQQLESATEDEAIQVADIILSIDDKLVADLLHKQIKLEYERCEKEKIDKGVAVYGVLSSLLAPKVQQGWAMYVAEKYKLPSLEVMPVYELFNQQMSNIQQYYFYNDDDGRMSYNNFIRTYQKSPLEWDIKEMDGFVIIQSKSGRKVEIYANKASDGEKGLELMFAFMQKNKLEPQVVVHRGLSTHTLKTFTRIPSSAKLILDGSCGGYHVQQVAIERAPGAQILCNRNVGTMHVNDPIFKQISDDIRTGKDLVWPDFWSKMNARVGTNPYFKDYIPPHKNAAAILLKALYDVLEIN